MIDQRLDFVECKDNGGMELGGRRGVCEEELSGKRKGGVGRQEENGSS